MRPLAFVLGLSLALSGLNVRSEPTLYVAKVQDAPTRAMYESVKGAFHSIVLYDRFGCSAVARSPSVLMFAEHCLAGQLPDAIIIDQSIEVAVNHIARDGNDHVLVSLKEAPFTQWVTLAKERPKQGDWVFLYGAPGRFGDLLRLGTFAGQEGDLIVYDLRTDHGDSGGAIFNTKGEVVDIVYGAPGDFGALTLCFPIQFTRSEELEVGL